MTLLGGKPPSRAPRVRTHAEEREAWRTAVHNKQPMIIVDLRGNDGPRAVFDTLPAAAIIPPDIRNQAVRILAHWITTGRAESISLTPDFLAVTTPDEHDANALALALTDAYHGDPHPLLLLARRRG